MNKLLECKNINKSFIDFNKNLTIFEKLNFSLDYGKTVAITGKSGIGKSTFLNILALLDDLDSGSLDFMGENILKLKEKQRASFRSKNIGFIYQFHHLLLSFTVLENIAMPLLIAGVKKKIAYQKSQKMLENVGLLNKQNKRPFELSGGEKQRVAIARALVGQAKLVLADEPTGNLDNQTAKEIIDLILSLNKKYDTAFIIVTHDLTIAKKMEKQYTLANKILNLV